MEGGGETGAPAALSMEGTVRVPLSRTPVSMEAARVSVPENTVVTPVPVASADAEQVQLLRTQLGALQLDPVMHHMFEGGAPTISAASFASHLAEYIAPETANPGALRFLFHGIAHAAGEEESSDALTKRAVASALSTLCTASIADVVNGVYDEYSVEADKQTLRKPELDAYLQIVLALNLALTPRGGDSVLHHLHTDEMGAHMEKAVELARHTSAEIFTSIAAGDDGVVNRSAFETWFREIIGAPPAVAATAAVETPSPDAAAEAPTAVLTAAETPAPAPAPVAGGAKVEAGATAVASPNAGSPRWRKERKGVRTSAFDAMHMSIKENHTEGWLLKKSERGKWQPRYFSTASHYLLYKNHHSDTEWLGGVELDGENSTIEHYTWTEKGREHDGLRVTGLCSDNHEGDDTPHSVMRTLDLSYDYGTIRHGKVGEDHMEPTIKVWMRALESAAGKLKGQTAARAAAELARERQAKAQRMAIDATPPLRAIAGSLLMADELKEGFADSSATPCYAALHSHYLVWRTTEGGALVAGLDLAGVESSVEMCSVVGADGLERAHIRVVGNDAAVGDDAEPELRSIDVFSNYLLREGSDSASPSIEEWFDVLDAVKIPATSSPGAVASMTRAFAKLDLVEVEDALFPGGARSVNRATFCNAMAAQAVAAGTSVDAKTLAFFFGAMAMLGGSDDHASADIEVVTAALSTKCVANHEDVTEAVYRVFDTEQTNTLTPAEIGRFLHTVMELTIRMKDCAMPYDAEHEEHASRFAGAVTENMFRTIDTDGNGFIERDEFGEWLEERIAPGAKRKAAPKPASTAKSSAADAAEVDAMQAAHRAQTTELRTTLHDAQRELAEAKQGSAAALKSELAALRIQFAAERAEWTRQTFEAQASHAAELARLRDALHHQPTPLRPQREPLSPAAAQPQVRVSRHGSIMVSQPVRAPVQITSRVVSSPVAIRAIRPASRQPYGAIGGLPSAAAADSERRQELGRAINASQDAQRVKEEQELAEKAKAVALRAKQLEQQTQRADAAVAAATRRAQAQRKELEYMRQRLGASEERAMKEREQSEALQRRLAGLGATSPSKAYALPSPPQPRTSPVSEYRDSYTSPEDQRRSRTHSPYYPAQYEQVQPTQVNVNRHGSIMISPSIAARSPGAARSPSPFAAAEQRSPLRSSPPTATMATLSPQPRPQYATRSSPYQPPYTAALAPAQLQQRARVNVSRNGSIVVSPARTPLGAGVANRSPHNADLLVGHSQRHTEALALLERAKPLWNIDRVGPSGRAREAYRPPQ